MVAVGSVSAREERMASLRLLEYLIKERLAWAACVLEVSEWCCYSVPRWLPAAGAVQAGAVRPCQPPCLPQRSPQRQLPLPSRHLASRSFRCPRRVLGRSISLRGLMARFGL